MAKSAKGNKNLNIVARIDGAGNVKSEVDKINTAVRSVGKTARETTAESNSLGDAFQRLNPQVDALAGKLMGMRSADPSGTLKNMAEALGMIPGPIGAVAMGITVALSAFSSLKDILTNDVTPATEKAAKVTDDLASAYLRLGDEATVAAAKEALAADKRFKAEQERLNTLIGKEEEYHQAVVQARVNVTKAEYALQEARQKGGALAQGQAEAALNRAKADLKTAEANEARLKRGIELSAQKLVQDKEGLKTDREREEEARRAQAEAERTGAAWAAEILAEEAAAQEVMDRNLKIAQAEMAALEAIRRTTNEAIWAADEHTASETMARQVEQQKRQVDDQIKNAERRAEAYRLIDEKAAADERKRLAEQQKQREQDQAKWLADAAKRAAAETAPKEDPQVAAINQRIAALQSDQARFLAMSEDELAQYSDQYSATQAAIVAAEEAKNERLQQIHKEEIRRINEEDKRIRQATYDRIKANVDLSKSTREAMEAQIKGAQAVAEGLDALGVGANAVTAAQMTASGIQAVCDAMDYTAQSVASFAIGNVGTGMGMAAAATGKWAAAAAYANGLIELGFSAFDSGGGGGAQQTPQPTTSSITGQQASEPTDINVTMMFSGQAGRLGRYLVEEINAEARTSGGARLNAGVVR